MIKKNGLIRNRVGFLLKLVSMTVALNVLIILLLFFTFMNRRQPQYFSTSVKGKYESLVAIEQPNTSDYAIMQWANLAAISCYTYDFLDYKTELDKVSEYFTKDGWATFVSALEVSNNLDAVVGKKLIVHSVATKPPIILQKGFLNGQYSWRIQIPLLVTYQAASGYNPQNILITMLVTRIPTLENYKGIGIQQFISYTYDITSMSAASLSQ